MERLLPHKLQRGDTILFLEDDAESQLHTFDRDLRPFGPSKTHLAARFPRR